MSQKTPFSVRLGDAEVPLEAGSLIADESRGEFIREAVKERYGRLVHDARRRREAGARRKLEEKT